MKLNKEQITAVKHADGPMLVTAGPGSGKTAVIVCRIRTLIEKYHVNPENILTVTFTRAAASQMEERFRKMSGASPNFPVFGTFHSIFCRILKKHDSKNIRIISEKEKSDLICSEIERFSNDSLLKQDMIPDIINGISRWKNNVYADRDNPEEKQKKNCGFSASDTGGDIFWEIYDSYQRILKISGKMDFDDILIKTYDILRHDAEALKYWQARFQYIQIDEFQDINYVQYKTIRLLAGTGRNIFAVGDADQSIYGFRGAAPEIMDEFRKDHPDRREVHLSINYRCPEVILTPCLKLIGQNTGRKAEKSVSRAFMKDPCFDIIEYRDQAGEYSGISETIIKYHNSGTAFHEMAVLVRSCSDMEYIRSMLKKEGIRVSGYESDAGYDLFRHFIAFDIRCYFKAAAKCASRKDILRIMNRPVRFISVNSIPPEPDEHLFMNIRKYYCRNPEAVKRINKFENDLAFLGKLTPSAGIEYILKAIGYENYIQQYASEHPCCQELNAHVIAELKKYAAACRSVSEYLNDTQLSESSAGKACSSNDSENINILTMHAAKGLEFKVVFLPDLNDGVIPTSHAQDTRSVNEERRLMYVAMTRASWKLHLSYCRYMQNRKTDRSLFIDELLR